MFQTYHRVSEVVTWHFQLQEALEPLVAAAEPADPAEPAEPAPAEPADPAESRGENCLLEALNTIEVGLFGKKTELEPTKPAEPAEPAPAEPAPSEPAPAEPASAEQPVEPEETGNATMLQGLLGLEF